MTTKHLMTGYFIAAVLLLSGCTGKVRYPNYYTLATAPTKQPAANAHPSGTVAVRRFEAPAYLRQGRIVYRQTPEEVGFYDYHRWAADPGAVVTAGLIDSLRSSNLFVFVEPYDGHDSHDYLVSGRLERLDEVDYNGGVQVEVKLSAQLVNARTGASVWAGAVTQTSSVPTRNVNSVVVAMSSAAQAGIDQLVADMEKHLPTTSMAAGNPKTAMVGMNRQ
jgi:ABC-type uncharacterized transport system auxiliary subunit